MEWDPGQYQRFTDQRALPFRHLLAALDHLEPAAVVDLGCGPGSLTATMLERWPNARIVGIDSSHEMIALADRRKIHDRLRFELGEVETWRAGEPVDLLFSNACFHWIDDHRALMDHLLPQLAAGGTLAFQVPANHDAPSHVILRELCSSRRWRDSLDGMPRTGVRELDWYRAELGDRGFAVTAWRTTYHHVLEGENPVLDWVKGTTLRPVLDLLPEAEHEVFLNEYGRLLVDAYPERDGRTSFPFRRFFVIARRIE